MDKKNLRKFLLDRYGKIEAAAPLISFGQPVASAYDVIVDVENLGTDDERLIMLTDLLENGIGVSEEDKKEIINEVLNRLPIAEEVSV